MISFLLCTVLPAAVPALQCLQLAFSLCRLDQELDFILSQQKELEDLLTPLEESVKEQSGTIYLQHADEERERT